MALYTQTFNASMSAWAGALNRITSRVLSAAPSAWSAVLNKTTQRILSAVPTAWAVTFTAVKSLHSYYQELDAATASFAATLSTLQFIGADLMFHPKRYWRTRRFS